MGCGPVTPAQMLSPRHYRSPPRSGSVRPRYQQCLFVPNHAHGTFSLKPTILLPLYGSDREMQRLQDLVSKGAYYHVSPENVPSLSFSSFFCNTQTQARKSSPSAVYGVFRNRNSYQVHHRHGYKGEFSSHSVFLYISYPMVSQDILWFPYMSFRLKLQIPRTHPQC